MIAEGGCQCGRVRYRVAGDPIDTNVCHCRMCQKASGGPFMVFVTFRAGDVGWATAPDRFASSNRVDRGFCRSCGTPLSYEETGSGEIGLTLNSLDDPSVAPAPRRNLAPAMQAPWLATLDRLVQGTGEPLAETPGFVSHQRP